MYVIMPDYNLYISNCKIVGSLTNFLAYIVSILPPPNSENSSKKLLEITEYYINSLYRSVFVHFVFFYLLHYFTITKFKSKQLRNSNQTKNEKEINYPNIYNSFVIRFC